MEKPIITEEFLRKLCNDEAYWEFKPLIKKNYRKIEKYIKTIKQIVSKISQNSKIIVDAKYNYYGSGFASYINIKIRKVSKSDTKTTIKKNTQTESIEGIEIYVSNLSPYWYYGSSYRYNTYENGIKESGGSYWFLRPDSIEKYDNTIWETTISEIKKVFEWYGYTLLTKQEVGKELWFDVNIETNIGKKPYKVFDCFFHRYD